MISLTSVEGTTTTVEVAADEGTLLADSNIVGRGVARTSPGDVFDPEVGRIIALGRAIQDFGRQVEADGEAAVVSKAEFARVVDHIRRSEDLLLIFGVAPGDIIVTVLPE